jgi:hypothetical protein
MLAVPFGLEKYDNNISKGFRHDSNDTLGNMIRCALALTHATSEEVVKSCLSCEFFNEQSEGCRKANGARPPARVIAFGCESYLDKDVIPF